MLDARLTAKAFMTISGGLSQNLLSMFNSSSSASSTRQSNVREVAGEGAAGASAITGSSCDRRRHRASVMAHYTVGQKLKRYVPRPEPVSPCPSASSAPSL